MMRWIATLSFCLAVLLSMPTFVHAFAVSPAIQEMQGSRGTVVEGTITIINPSTAEQTYYLGTLKFLPREDSGAPQFIPYEEDHSGLAEWISFPQATISLAAQSYGEATYRITIPDDVASGTYQAAVIVSDTPSEVVATNGATVNAKMAVLLFLTVEGETVEQAALLDFVTPDGPLLTDPSLSFAYRIQNQGNVLLTPRATITVRDFLDRTVLTMNANAESARILPATTRTFSGEVGEGSETQSFVDAVESQLRSFAIGPLTYTLEVTYGSDERTLVAHLPTVWMFPFHLAIVVTALVAALSLFLKGVQRLSQRNSPK